MDVDWRNRRTVKRPQNVNAELSDLTVPSRTTADRSLMDIIAEVERTAVFEWTVHYI